MDAFAEPNLPWMDRGGADIDGYAATVADENLGYDLKEALHHWNENGFLILKNVVDQSLIDAYREDLNELQRIQADCGVLVNCESHGIVPIRELQKEDIYQPAFRVLDFHNASVAGKKLALDKPIVKFLAHVFRQPVVAMQSLTFLRGTQQGTHQDFAYVVAEKPYHLSAAWVALEDVNPEAGPVGYYRGSHRIPRFDFGNGPFLTDESPYRENEFQAYLEKQCEDAGLPFEELLVEKGDVLIWHAALAHRGTVVKNPDLTRLSYVVHYSSAEAYTRERRAPEVENPHRYYHNDAYCFGDPIRPELENTFTAGGPWIDPAG